jgi:hypothetical protein
MLDSLCRESSRCASANSPLSVGLVFLRRFRRFHSPSNRPDLADRRSAPIARLLPFHANDVGKWGKSLSSCTERSEHRSEPLRLRRFRANGTREIAERKRHAPVNRDEDVVDSEKPLPVAGRLPIGAETNMTVVQASDGFGETSPGPGASSSAILGFSFGTVVPELGVPPWLAAGV